MKFTDGYWLSRPGLHPLYATEVDDVRVDEVAGTMTVFAPTSVVRDRGDTLNRPVVTLTYSSPAPGVVTVRVEHHAGAVRRGPDFAVHAEPGFRPVVKVDETAGVLETGGLSVRVHRQGAWRVDFEHEGRVITSSLPKSVAVIAADTGEHWVHEQLALSPGEHVYGLGERFGPFVKNGQEVDVWNADGGTSSEQAYKNVPFYVTSAGYGVFVAHPEKVSLEVASEVNSRVQLSVPGQSLTYHVVAGPTPKDVLRRYTALTGRPPRVPAWSYGLWLSTSFTTDYDERTVTSFIDGMAERDLPLSVFHFDCFWMREYQWCDFEWDPRTFPDPEGMLARLHARGLQVSAWINPYIAQRSPLFAEGAERGYLLRTEDGGVWQWDLWQAGMGLVDFTNPAATDWYLGHLERLLDQGVDCFKTDFGERVPAQGVVWHDGSDPQRMHNYYAQLYNEAVFGLLERRRGAGEAVVFARAATAGGQQMPVHWGGDCDSTYTAMAESLRGGLSLAMSGFGYWSHDIGGFEGTPDAGVFKRWLAFGLLSSHSRLHGSSSYRVPWAFDDEAVDVARRFTHLKMRLMPYLGRLAEEVAGAGTPMMRPMVLEFPGDRSTYGVDTQYMLGDSLLVAPVLREDGTADVYVPEGRWTLVDPGSVADGGPVEGPVVTGPRWVAETHGYASLPLLVRPGSVLPVGARTDRPDYAWAEGVTLHCVELAAGHDSEVSVPGGEGAPATFRVRRTESAVVVSSGNASTRWAVQVGGLRTEANGPDEVRIDL
ncbi:alpha-D-xyloside xylohydrolase [Isoptericola sp. CG 20/1183]|uniref:Alpha-D-xyloside xylohydrolase n=1 Tax=Isoptericola halotolerans TaxID=300560 RepID=A0ABX5EBF8_9MICO|nr:MULTISPECIES: alpha-xylosidase [Isoptericola]PRZ04841.1 alpha-D-xyloside xylohydrolase [Isoptericola halotolerans]PRZ05332.1 alpha-D-xyloside xylohydrolase [Isoptericola sp. CG 20/1183]